MIINKKIKIIAWALIIIVIAIFVYKLGLVSKLKNVKSMQKWFRSFGKAGYLVYLIIFCLASVCMIPAAILTIVAEITYGPILGAIMAIIGATCGATLCFLISKYFMRDIMMSMIGKNKLFTKIDNGFKANGAKFLILTRLIPLFPFNLQNYAYGLTSIKTSTYVFWTFICIMPGILIYAYMSGEIVSQGISCNTLIKFTAAGIILCVVSLIAEYIGKKKGITLK